VSRKSVRTAIRSAGELIHRCREIREAEVIAEYRCGYELVCNRRCMSAGRRSYALLTADAESTYLTSRTSLPISL
jgi:hypothetical protein